MPNKDSFKELIKKLNRHKKGLRDPRIMHPEREWVIGIIAMVVMFVGSALWSSHMYLKNRNVTAVEVPVDEVVVYREAIVQDVLQRFAGRKKTYDQLTTGVVVTPKETEVQPTATTTPRAEEVAEELVATSSTDVGGADEAPLRAQ